MERKRKRARDVKRCDERVGLTPTRPQRDTMQLAVRLAGDYFTARDAPLRLRADKR